MNLRKGPVTTRPSKHVWRLSLLLAMLFFVMFFSSCATIISGTTAKIYLEGDVDEPLTVVTSKSEYQVLTLPATVKVKRHSIDGQHIQISSDSYAFSDIILRKSLNPWAVLDAFSEISLVVDLLTNAVSKPAQDRFFITPDAPQSQADSLHRADSLRWAKAEEAHIRARILERQLPLHYKRNEIRGSIGFGNCQASHDRDRMTDSYVERYDLTGEGECFDLVGEAYLQAGLEYHYRLNRKWDVGVLADWGISRGSYSAYYFTSEDVHSPTAIPDDWASANECCRFFVFAPSVRYTWSETNNSRCYSRIALGAMRHHLTFDYKRYPWNDYQSVSNSFSDIPSFTDGTDDVKWRMAYQLTVIGAAISSQSFNLFGEIGYGNLGIVRLGVGFVF